MAGGVPHRISLGPRGPLRGSLRVPGDKSISHRAILLNSLASGPARVRGLLHSHDVHATLAAVRQLGVLIRTDGDEVHLTPPQGRLRAPRQAINCGNSGTTLRLLAGLLAGQGLLAVLTGDASLRRRPMMRITAPLRRMGATIEGQEHGALAPLTLCGGALTSCSHRLSVSSAQVKSALLLAGLRCGVEVHEPRRSRDHTERMLRQMGAELQTTDDLGLVLSPVSALAPLDLTVPGDISAAAFWMVAACLVPGSELKLVGVGMNPTRTGVVDALLQMGADIQVDPLPAQGCEPVANLTVRHGPLIGTTIRGELALRCIDELPVLCVAAAFAQGQTTIADAAELRLKESDRIARMAKGLGSLGFEVQQTPDGMVIEGGAPSRPARVNATGDHRIAMAFAVAGLAGAEVSIEGANAIASSYPSFLSDLETLCA